jgi:hypothetical protein
MPEFTAVPADLEEATSQLWGIKLADLLALLTHALETHRGAVDHLYHQLFDTIHRLRELPSLPEEAQRLLSYVQVCLTSLQTQEATLLASLTAYATYGAKDLEAKHRRGHTTNAQRRSAVQAHKEAWRTFATAYWQRKPTASYGEVVRQLHAHLRGSAPHLLLNPQTQQAYSPRQITRTLHDLRPR